MRKKARNLFIIFIVLTLLIVVGIPAILYFMDPFRLYHKEPRVCKNEVTEHMRYNAHAFLKYKDYDSIILGTSRYDRLLASYASQQLNKKFINISFGSGRISGRTDTLNYALKNYKIDTIIYSLDKEYFAGEYENSMFKTTEILYDDNKFNDIKIYFNTKFIPFIFKRFIKYIFKRKINCENENFIGENFTLYKIEEDTPPIGIENWSKERKEGVLIEVKTTQKDILNFNEFLKSRKEFIDENLITFIKEYPNVNFILIIPAYTMAYEAVFKQRRPQDYEIQKEILKYILEQDLPNAKIFAFNNVDYITNINNFYDLSHHSPQINNEIIKLVAQNQGLLTKENFEEFWQTLSLKAQNFDLEKFEKELEAALEKDK